MIWPKDPGPISLCVGVVVGVFPFVFGAVFIASFCDQGRVMEVIEGTVFYLLAASLLSETSAVAPLPEEKLNVVSRM